MDFAPYQDDSPSEARAKSPSPPPAQRNPRTASPRPYPPAQRNIGSVLGGAGGSRSNQQYQHLPDPNSFGSDDVEAAGESRSYQEGTGMAEGGSGAAGGRTYIDLFETSLPLRLDYEAMAAYLLLPPLGGVLLLILEHKSDYVRFHAWQSAMLFSAIFVLHLIFSAVTFLSWMLFIVDVALIGFLTFRAYKDADTLDRFEIPPFGRFATNFVDDE